MQFKEVQFLSGISLLLYQYYNDYFQNQQFIKGNNSKRNIRKLLSEKLIEKMFAFTLASAKCAWSPAHVCAQAVSRVQLLRPQGLWPARLLCPWDSSGKNPKWAAMPSSRGSS